MIKKIYIPVCKRNTEINILQTFLLTILSKEWWKQKLGTKYRPFALKSLQLSKILWYSLLVHTPNYLDCLGDINLELKPKISKNIIRYFAFAQASLCRIAFFHSFVFKYTIHSFFNLCHVILKRPIVCTVPVKSLIFLSVSRRLNSIFSKWRKNSVQ